MRLRGSVLGFFLKSYLAILLLPVLFGSIVVVKSSRIVLEDTIIMNSRILGQAEAALDRTQTTVDELIAQISYNRRLSALIHRDSIAPTEVYAVRAAQRELSTHFVLSDFIDEVYLWSANTDMLLSTGTTFLHADLFYHPFYAFPDKGYSEWKRFFTESRKNRLWLPALTMGEGVQAVRVLPYVQSLPLDIPTMNRGFVMVTIREDVVQDLLLPSVADHGGWAAVYDRGGVLLTSVGDASFNHEAAIAVPEGNGSFQTSRGRGNYVITHRTSPESGLRLISVTPARKLLEKTQYIRNLAFIVDALILVLGAAVAVLIARRQSYPLVRLFKTAHVDRVDGKGFTDAIAQVDEQFASMEASVTRQRPLVEASQFWRLISGQVSDPTELRSTFTTPAVREHHHLYVLVLLQLRREVTDTTPDTLRRLNYAKAALRNLIWRRLPDTSYIHDVDAATLVILIAADDIDEAELRSNVDSTIAGVRTVAEEQYAIEFFCSASSVRRSLVEAAAAFGEAQEVAEGTSAAVGGKPVFWYAPGLRSTVAGYYYPIADEARITTAVKAGDYVGIVATVESIWERNFTDGPKTPQAIHLLLTEMLSTTIKCARELKMDDLPGVADLNRRIADCADSYQARGIVESLLASYRELCTAAVSRKKSHNRVLCEQVIVYMKERFSDSSLSLTSVADRFGMSNAYFSSFFKEQSGRNFAELLEDIRLKAALELLPSGRTIGEVAGAVGYNSSNTFRRAFKRRFGVSPSTQRREIVLDSAEFLENG